MMKSDGIFIGVDNVTLGDENVEHFDDGYAGDDGDDGDTI